VRTDTRTNMRSEPATQVELLRWRADRSPERTIYTLLRDGETEGASLTIGELDRRARAIGAALQAMAVSGDRALLLYPPGLEFITAFFGCLYAGTIGVPAPLPGARGALSRLRSIAADAQVSLVLTTTRDRAEHAPMF